MIASVEKRAREIIPMPAVRRFIVGDHFTKHNSEGVNIQLASSQFLIDFLAKDMQEEDVPETHLISFFPSKAQHICKLHQRYESTALAHIWKLLKEQPRGVPLEGRPERLLSDGSHNVFCVKNHQGELVQVLVNLGITGWIFRSIHEPDEYFPPGAKFFLTLKAPSS